MNGTIKILIWAAVVLVIFGITWKNGMFMRMSNYVAETREELRKCTWPTMDELKDSTVVVGISILLLSGFTVFADFVISSLVHLVM